MDLQQVLHYRDNCVICQKELTYFIPDYPQLDFSVDDKRFYLSHKDKPALSVNFDNEIMVEVGYRNKYKHHEIFKDPLRIIKGCKNCQSEYVFRRDAWETPLNRIHNTYHTSLNNIKAKECSYTFSICQASKKYFANLQFEVIRFHDDKQFYHIDSSHQGNVSALHHASFDAKLEDIFYLNLSSVVNLSNIKDLDSYIKKCRTIMLFS
jgi:hypothetical protein